MPVQRDTIERLLHEGEYLEVLRVARPLMNSLSDAESSTQLAIAHALAVTGEIEKARAIARLDSRSDANTRSRAELVLGIAADRNGEVDLATKHFKAAVQAGDEATTKAWAQLHLFRTLGEGHPERPLAAVLSETRRLVTAAATPQTSAYLHICVSALEGQKGLLEDASRHCTIAEALLDRDDNISLRGSVYLNRASIAWLRRRFAEASSYLAKSRELVSRSGNTTLLRLIEGHLGHAEMVRGEFARAERIFSSLLAAPNQTRRLTTGTTESLARLFLATGDLDRCSEALQLIDEFVTREPASALEYHTRWAAIPKARLLMRTQRANDAAQFLLELDQHTRAVGDVAFNCAIELTLAQCFGLLGKTKAAASALLSAAHQGITSNREYQAQYYYAASGIVSSPDLARQLDARAHRLWREHGTASLPGEMEVGQPAASSHISEDDDLDVARCVVNSIAAMFDLASSPRQLAAEIVDISHRLSNPFDIRVLESRGSALEAGTSGQIALDLSSASKKTLRLVCTAPDRPQDAVLLSDLLRIGRAALDLETAHQEARSRAALWPESPIEEQAGALYLAENMQALLATARRIAPTNVPVLITGETGTGKEVLARTIHAYSQRAAKTFLPFNCTATPREMLDAQLFGHRRGAFTGATDNFSGIIRAASGGTLFLDEIGETTLDVQPKLLRFLEAGEVHPIGETQPTKVDVRVITATNADLDSLVAQGRFREDLFYRLNIVRLHVPPLRERRVEIPALANYYLQKYGLECGKRDLRIAEETMEYLVLYRWPGNVRQLANEMRRLAALAENGAVVMPEHLSADIAASRKTIPASERVLEPVELVVRMDQPLPAAVQHLEQAMIQYALAKCGHHMEDTAALLGLSRKGLYLKRQRFGVESPSGDDVEFA